MHFQSDGKRKQQIARCAVSPHIKNDDYLVPSIPLNDKHRLVVDAVLFADLAQMIVFFRAHSRDPRQMCFVGSTQCLRITTSSYLRSSFPCPSRFIKNRQSPHGLFTICCCKSDSKTGVRARSQDGRTAMGIMN